MPDTKEKKQSSFTPSPLRIERKARQEARKNRSPSTKGIVVNIGDNIQRAIDDVEANDGGVVNLITGTYPNLDYDIVVPSNVTLSGEGKQNTILDFNDNAKGVKITGASGSIKSSITLKEFAILNSGDSAGLDINYADDVSIDDVLVSSCTNDSVRMRHSRFITLRDVFSDTPGGNGFTVSTTSDRSVININFYSCVSQSFGGIGYSFTNSGSQTVGNIYMFGCRANNGTGDCYDFAGGVQMDGALISCMAANSGAKGYDINVQNMSFIACIAEGNTDDGFENTDLENKFIGCKSEGNGTEWDIQTTTTFVGNSLDFGSSTDPYGEFSSAITDSGATMMGNVGTSPSTNTKIVRMKNSSGGTRAAGRPVIYKDTTNTRGDEFDVSTTEGDDRVAGMLLESPGDGSWAEVLQEGYTKLLKVDGTDDIAIGDFICYNTSVNPTGKKAEDGDMAFAIALEAYTNDDTSGVIDALIIRPIKIGLKDPTVDVPIVLTMFDAVPERDSESNWNGALLLLEEADTLANGDDITTEKGTGKVLVVVIASNDAVGDITVTGDTVDRNTGVVSLGDTDTLTLAGNSTDNTTTDSNGNLVHKFVGAYITSKWFTGEIVLSTTEVDLTDVDVYHVSFEQFNDQPNITIDTLDANIFTTNANAEFDAYLFDLHITTGDKCDVENHAELHVGADGETAIEDVYWRLRQSNINEVLDGTTDGVWVDVHYGGFPSSTEDVTIKIWATCSQALTLT